MTDASAFDWPRPEDDWTVEILNKAKQAVEDRMLAVDLEASAIESQIRQAEQERAETGIYADRDWWRRANGARKFKGRERQRCQQLLGDINTRIRRKNGEASNQAVGRQFISAAKAMLPPETYEAIWKRVRAENPVVGALS